MNIKYKLVTLDDYKKEETEDGVYISGYANTKGKPDSYGDIPTNYKGRPVYDLKTRFLSNPVALVDHKNSIGNIFGTWVFAEEDEKGLAVKLKLMKNPQTDIARHAVEAYKSGDARAFSISGEFSHEDEMNKSNLTKAVIYEISGVAIPADSRSLSNTPKPKSFDTDKTAKAHAVEVVEFLVAEYRKSQNDSILQTIKQIRENIQ